MSTAANHSEPLLALEHVLVNFGGLRALADVSFCVHAGEIVGLIGPNGAGKTTAFNLITGFLPPSSGRIVYRGIELNGRPPHAIAALGVIRTFQRTSVFPQSTVLENALIGLTGKAVHGYGTRFSRCRATPRNGIWLRKHGAFCSSSGSRRVLRTSPPRFPMESKGSSGSQSPWPRGRSCYCWTSPYRE